MFPSWLCYYLPLPIISLYGHAVLEGVHRLSKVFAFWKIRTFVLRSLPVVYDVFVLAFQTVLDVMTITCPIIWLVGFKVKGQTGLRLGP